MTEEAKRKAAEKRITNLRVELYIMLELAHIVADFNKNKQEKIL